MLQPFCSLVCFGCAVSEDPKHRYPNEKQHLRGNGRILRVVLQQDIEPYYHHDQWSEDDLGKEIYLQILYLLLKRMACWP